ncbi:Aldo/keto reductase [Cytidiella melzeri]|nr:Aldo/keto reductase [Cytidiella melzeri]
MATAKIIYGTAWKKERTATLVVNAILSGFRAIDTAGQPRHYREELVGEALETLQREHGIKREELFLQTKFTSLGGHDRSKPIPYDPNSRLETQVHSSFNNSLNNLRTTYVDSYILHSPLETLPRTLTAWKALIQLQDLGKVKFIGVSNTYDVSVLEALERDGGRRVQVVQNRWFEGNGWDADVLAYCRKYEIQYQSFWTLSGSPSLLAHPDIKAFARSKGCSPAQAVYRLAQLQGITPLSGTTDEEHMREDIAVENIEVDAESENYLNGAVTWMGLQ